MPYKRFIDPNNRLAGAFMPKSAMTSWETHLAQIGWHEKENFPGPTFTVMREPVARIKSGLREAIQNSGIPLEFLERMAEQNIVLYDVHVSSQLDFMNAIRPDIIIPFDQSFDQALLKKMELYYQVDMKLDQLPHLNTSQEKPIKVELQTQRVKLVDRMFQAIKDIPALNHLLFQEIGVYEQIKQQISADGDWPVAYRVMPYSELKKNTR